jgi:uncharacterized membrane protein YwaF
LPLLQLRTTCPLSTLTVTAAYTAGVGLVDAVTGANYMFLRQPPPNWTVLRLVGPWPWYIPGAPGVALVLLVVLDAPFRRGRREHSGKGRRCGNTSRPARLHRRPAAG